MQPETTSPSPDDFDITEDRDKKIEQSEQSDDWIPVEDDKEPEEGDHLQRAQDAITQCAKEMSRDNEVSLESIDQLNTALTRAAQRTESYNETEFNSLLFQFNLAIDALSDQKAKVVAMRAFLDNIGQIRTRVAKSDTYEQLYFQMLRSCHQCNIRNGGDFGGFGEATDLQIRSSYDIFRLFYERDKAGLGDEKNPWGRPDFISAKPRHWLDLCFYIDFIDPDVAQDYRNIVRNSLAKLHHLAIPDLGSAIDPELLGSLIASDDEVINNQVSAYLEQENLDFGRLKTAWSTTAMNQSRSRHIGENLKSIIDFESYQPGMCAILNREYGIEFFSRYPEKVLIDQYERTMVAKTAPQERSQEQGKLLNRPYGIVMFPQSDWNGAFYGDFEPFRNLYVDQLEKMGYALVVTEVSGKFSAAKQLIKLDREFGDRGKIQFAFLGGHGTNGSIKFGERKVEDESSGQKHEDFYGTLNIPDVILGGWTDKIQSFFVENPTAILVSCSTGQKYGIGSMMSYKLKTRLFAPNAPTNLRSINVTQGQTGLDFEVEYYEEGSVQEYNQGLNTNDKIESL